MSDTDPLFSRRAMVGATLGVASATLLAGCKPCFSPWPPPSGIGGGRPGARTFTLRAQIRPHEFRDLRAVLDDPDHNPFKVGAWGIHYARLFTVGHESLYFMIIYDDYDDAINFLAKNAADVDRVFRFCSGFPEQGCIDVEGLDAFVRGHLVCVELFYRAYDNPQFQIRAALRLRDSFLKFVQDREGASNQQLRALYADLTRKRDLGRMGVDLDKVGQSGGTAVRRDDLGLLPVTGPDHVNPFTLLARVHDEKVAKLRRLLQLGTFASIDLGVRALAKLPTLHFARVSIVGDNQLLFASVYDGDFIQYVEDFGTRIAKEIDMVFGPCIGYPLAGSRDVAQFKAFLRANQIETNAFAGAYLARSLLQIQSSLALAHALERFRRRFDPQHPRLPDHLTRFLAKHQLLLT